MMQSERYMRSGLTATIIIVAALTPAQALAHRIDVSVRSVAEGVLVEAHYHDDVPVREARVTVTDPDGNALVEGTTDADGRFLFTLAEIPAHVNVVVDTGDGHRGTVTRSREDLTGPPDAEEDHEHEEDDSSADHDELHEIEAALTRVENELHEITHELEHLSERQPDAMFERILAGVGFILGLTGVAAYCLARRGQPGQSS